MKEKVVLKFGGSLHMDSSQDVQMNQIIIRFKSYLRKFGISIILFLNLFILTIPTLAQVTSNDTCIFPILTGRNLGQDPPGNVPELFAPGIISTSNKNEFIASFSPDGKEFYFNRGMRIMVSTLNDGVWSYPKQFSPSADFPAHEAHITYDNKKIYWGWFKDDEYGIYYCDRILDGWSEPKNAGMEGIGMCITSDRSGKLFITKEEPGRDPVIARVEEKDGLFVKMIPINGAINNTIGVKNNKGFRNMSHPGISPDGSYILFDCNGGNHLWVTFREPDGSWSTAVDMSNHGIDKEFGLATVSRDGKYIFLSKKGDIYWISASIIEKLRPKDIKY